MTPSEIANLLALSSTLDPYFSSKKDPDDLVAAWTAVITMQAPELSFKDARALVVEYYGSEGESLTPYALVELWKKRNRMLPTQVAADVRVAKRLGFVGKDHPHNAPLDDGATRRLAEYRAKVNADAPAIEHAPNVSPLKLDVGRRP